MAKQEYTENSVLRILNKFRNIEVNSNTKTIYIVKNTTEIGNGTYGKIDYLIKVHGYKTAFVNQLTKRNRLIATKHEREDTDIYKGNKRDKINMAAMVRATMKKNKK